ncbi:MAG: ferritin-like domain-containing protein [Prosthecobacter sp.]
MKLNSLTDLFQHEIKDLYSAEKQLVKALPKMAKAATNPDLAAGFEEHLAETQEHVNRLEQISKDLGFSLGRHKCKAMEGLIEEGADLIEEDAQENVRDAGLIGAAQRVEHYEIAGYGTARTLAMQLDLKAAADLLGLTLEEEKATDIKLSKLAANTVNVEAAEAGGDNSQE